MEAIRQAAYRGGLPLRRVDILMATHWLFGTRAKYLVKIRSMVPGKHGRMARTGPWRTVNRLNSEAAALEYAATLSPRFEVKVYYQGKRVINGEKE